MTYRGAHIGFGNVAANAHLPRWLLRDDVEIVAAADGAPERRSAFRAAAPDGRWYDDATALLDAETLDFVDISTPPGSHAALIEAALERDLHVLCEKPLVTDAAVLDGIAGEAEKRGRVV